MNLDTARLRYFVTAAKTENLQEASRLLRLSPAALSKSIRSLESELGVSLFRRDGRHITLTDVGVHLAGEAQMILDDVSRRLYRREQFEERGQRVSLGSFEVFTTYFLGELLDEDGFDFSIGVLELTPGHLEEALEEHRIDIGITYLPVPRPKLEFIKVCNLSMAVFGAANSRFAKQDPKTWPFAVPVTPVVGAATRVLGLDGWPDDRVPRIRKYEVTMMESGLELVRRGKAVIYLPTFLAKLHNRSVKRAHQLIRMPKLPAVGGGQQSVYIVKRKATPETDAIRRISHCLRRVCRDDA